MGHGQVLDHMFLDGLENAYDGALMGRFAEDTAEKYQFTRAVQDEFALTSLTRARKAAADGIFLREIVPVKANGEMVGVDEQPTRSDPAKIPQLKPAFRDGGTVTAANSSSISDGAAALILMSEAEANRNTLRPIARIVGHATHAQEPAWFTTAPVGAIEKLLAKIGWRHDEVDLYEINEAFAVVALAAIRDLHLSQDKVNVHGGACALGHPIGASGARIIVTLLNALEAHNLKRGVASPLHRRRRSHRARRRAPLMTALSTRVDDSTKEFTQNAEAMNAAVADLEKRLAEIRLGGDEAARKRHTDRGKMLPRARVARAARLLEQVAPHGRRCDFRDMLMLGDRHDFFFVQSA